MSSLNKFLIFIIAALIIAGQFVPMNVQSTEKTAIPATPMATFTPTPIPVAAPYTISIPKIGVQATVEAVSTDFDGRMNMPEDYAKVAWYSPGTKPGDLGNAVIAGHLDTTTGAPALFYNLRYLESDDKVMVTDENGRLYTFTVTHKETYDFNQAPIPEIFGPADSKNLNLMTCAGWWNQATHNYSQRIVIYTQLQN